MESLGLVKGRSHSRSNRRVNDCVVDRDVERVRSKVRSGIVDEEEDAKSDRLKKGGLVRMLSGRSKRQGAGKEAAAAAVSLASLAKRFEYYKSAAGEWLEQAGFRRLICDSLGGNINSKRMQQLWALADTQHDDKVTFDEFVSLFSFSLSELVETANELRDSFKRTDAKTNALYDSLSSGQGEKRKLSADLLCRQVLARLDKDLLPGEAQRLCTLLGTNLSGFKRYLKANPDKWAEEKLSERGFTKLDLVSSVMQKKKKTGDPEDAVQDADKVVGKMEGYYLVYQSAQSQVRKPVPLGSSSMSKSSKRTSRGGRRQTGNKTKTSLSDSENDETDSVEEKEEDQDSDNSSDSRVSQSSGSSASGSSLPSVASAPSRSSSGSSSYLASENSLLEHIEISKTPRDPFLVSGGFRCVETPLGSMFSRQYMWLKTEQSVGGDSANTDMIVDIALTYGRISDLRSPIWSPPCKGFKRVSATFRKGKEEAFLWYRKRDSTYGREGLMRRSLTTLGMGTSSDATTTSQQPYMKALEKQVRQRVRDAVSHKAAFNPQSIFAKRKKTKDGSVELAFDPDDVLTKKEFVVALDKLGLQLRPKDLALIYDRLDSAGTGKVHRDDVIEFFELSDAEIETVLRQVRDYLKRVRRDRGQSIEALFKQLAGGEAEDGKMSPKVFQKVLRTMGVSTSFSEVQRLVDVIDTDGNGFVDLAELAQFLRADKGQAKLDYNGRSKHLPSRLRRAAQVLHSVAREKGSKGHSSGQVNSKLNTAYAWDRLVTSKRSSNGAADVLDVQRLMLALKPRGVTLRKSEAAQLLEAIDPRADKSGGIEFRAFEEFLLHEPAEEASESELGDVSEKKRENKSEFLTALLGFQRDLNSLALSRGLDSSELFSLLLGARDQDDKRGTGRRVKRVSREGFKQMMENAGSARNFSGSDDMERLLSILDKDADSWISVHDFDRFLHSQLEDDSDSEEESAGGDADWRASSPRSDSWRASSPRSDSWRASSPRSDSWRSRKDGDSVSHSARSPSNSIARYPRSLSPSSSGSSSSPASPSSPLKRFARVHRPERINRGLSEPPVWWLRNKPSESQVDQDDHVDPEERLVSKLVENDLKQAWRRELADSKPNHSGKEEPGLSASVDVAALCSAAEAAVRMRNAPLRLRQRFRRYDPNDVGAISKRNFLKVLDHLGLVLPETEHAALSKVLLSRVPGKVDYKVFCEILSGSSESSPGDLSRVHARIRHKFEGVDFLPVMQSFDPEGSGALEPKDMHMALRLCDVQLSVDDWKALRPWLLRDDRRLSYEALAQVLNKAPSIKENVDAHKGPSTPEQDKNVLKKVVAQVLEELSSRQALVPGESVSEWISSELESCDHRGYGHIASDDFCRILSKWAPKSKSKHGLVALHFDCGRQRVDYAQFTQALEVFGRQSRQEEDILRDLSRSLRGLDFQAALKRHDVEGTGFVSRYQFRTTLTRELRVDDLSSEDWMILMELCNSCGDNFVDYAMLANKLAALPTATSSSCVPHGQSPTQFCLDFRHLFRTHSLAAGESGQLVPAAFVAALLQQSGLSPDKARSSLTLHKYLDLIDVDEQGWDILIERFSRRIEQLERQGVFLAAALDVQALSKTVIAQHDFFQELERLAIPLSEVESEMIVKRFSDGKGNVLHGRLVDFIKFRERVRSIANFL